MTNDQIEKLIWDELKERDVTIYDMVGLPNHGVDPNPEDQTTPRSLKCRSNRFNETFGSERMKEILCVGEYNPYDEYPPLKIFLEDLFRFWWSRCIDQHLFVDEILEDIYDYFTEQMRPPEKEMESIDLTIDFGQLPLFMTEQEKAA